MARNVTQVDKTDDKNPVYFSVFSRELSDCEAVVSKADNRLRDVRFFIPDRG